MVWSRPLDPCRSPRRGRAAGGQAIGRPLSPLPARVPRKRPRDPRASLFPDRLALLPPRGRNVVPSGSVVGSLSPAPPPTLRLPRSVCRAVGVVGGGGAPFCPVPASRVSCPPRPCPGTWIVAFRRVGLKTPGGVALPSPGSGGTVGRRGASSGSLGLLDPIRGRSRGCGWWREPPLWAPVGLAPRVRPSRAVAGGRAPCPSVLFPARSRPFTLASVLC